MLDLNFTLEDAYETAMSATATQGRVTEINLQEADIVSASVAEQPAYGHAAINPDNKLALVLSGTTSIADLTVPVQITHSDGTVETKTVTITVENGTQQGGWAIGDHYLLETDENDRSVIEPGRVHRKVYISGSVDAWSRQDIATAEGVSLSTIQPNWLRDHSFYGGSPEEPLDDDAANWLFASITSGNKPASTWYLFERGYTYSEFFKIGTIHFVAEMRGESPLHPLYFGAWGTGDRPILMVKTQMNTGAFDTVFQDIMFGEETTDTGGLAMLGGENLLIEQCFFNNANATFQNMKCLTTRHTAFDIHEKLEPANPAMWDQSNDRTSAFFTNKCDRVLVEYTFGDHNGWGDGYQYDQDGAYPQSPSAKSQQNYIQYNCTDVTFRRNVASRAAGCNIQLRCGGFLQESALLASNCGNNFGPGDTGDTGDTGNYTMVDAVVQSGALWKEAVADFGWYAAGFYLSGHSSTLKDLIVCLPADPLDAADVAEKDITQTADWTNPLVYVNAGVTYTPAYDDAIAYDWGTGVNPAIVPTPSVNIDGLDTEVLDTLTYQTWLNTKLSTTGSTIADVAQHFRDIQLAGGNIWPELQDYLNFVQTGFGRDGISTRSTPTTLNFVPKAIFDGVRWDNPNNWDSEDIPIDGDSLNLRGNKTRSGGMGSLSIAGLTFGKGGSFSTNSGKLTVTGTIATAADGNTVTITRAGQVWITDYAGANALAVNVSSGRFAVLGDVTGRIDLAVSGKAEVLLATAGGADYAVGAGSIAITGSTALVGFDGENGDAVSLTLGAASTLAFVADSNWFTPIRNVVSGAFAASSVVSTVVLGGTLHLDLTADPGNGTYTLIDVDTVSGSFDTVTAAGNGSKALTIAKTGTNVTVQIANGAGTITNDT